MPNHPPCILTDSTALLPATPYIGQHLVRALPVRADGMISIQTLLSMYENLERDYGSILVLTASQHLTGLYPAAVESAQAHGGSVKVIVIDSFSIGSGIGWLAALAAELAESGSALAEIEKQIRHALPHIYHLISIPDLNRLVRLGLLEPDQASAGSILGIKPMFTLEEGRLTLFDKVRSQRHLLEAFEEFAGEFENPRQIALARGSQSHIRSRALRESIEERFPQTEYNDLSFTPALAALLGEGSLSLAVME